SSSGTLPATAVIASIFNSGDFMASRRASASSTPGSVSTTVRKGPFCFSDWPCSRNPRSAKDAGARPLTAKAPADATNSRLVQSGDCFFSMLPFKSDVFIGVRLLTVASNTKIGHQGRDDLLHQFRVRLSYGPPRHRMAVQGFPRLGSLAGHLRSSG